MEELRKDVAEVRDLLSRAVRPKVQDLLSLHLFKLEAEVTALAERENQERQAEISARSGATSQPPPSTTNPGLYTVQLTTYGFDQSDKFVKLYLTSLPKGCLQTVKAEDIHTDFQDRSVAVSVRNVEGKNYDLIISNLLHHIDPQGSYVKMKAEHVLVMLKKKKPGEHWDCVTQQEQRLKDKKKPKMNAGGETEGDPSAGIMNLMKQMYEEGDDDMKRTIAKAWTESRDKQGAGGGAGMGAGMGMEDLDI